MLLANRIRAIQKQPRILSAAVDEILIEGIADTINTKYGRGYTDIAEIKAHSSCNFLETNVLSNVSIFATASSSHSGSFLPGKAVDGSHTTRWASSVVDDYQWIKLELDSPVVVGCLSIISAEGFNYIPSRIKVTTRLSGVVVHEREVDASAAIAVQGINFSFVLFPKT
jgi:hypothetical protein